MKAEKPETTENTPKRLNLNLSAQVYADLNNLSIRTGRSLSEIVRLGLGLAKFVYELGSDEKLGVFDKEGKLLREVRLLG